MKTLTKLAREQRKSENLWEANLWRYLRAHRFLNLQFKRQLPIGPYIVDFCCRSKMLVIELDGGQHSDKKISKKDIHKQRYLESLGFTVLRFWNTDIRSNIESVLENIRQSII